MNTKLILIAALLAGAFAPAMASTDATDEAPMQFHFASGEADDTGGPREVKRDRFVINGQEVEGLQHERGPLGGPMMHMRGKAVKNAPYSAEVVSEQQHNLADGNQIVNKTSTMNYRDSAGRTRLEVRDASGNARTVTIFDTVAGVTYMAHMAAEKAHMAGEHARVHIDEMRKEGGEQVIIKRIERKAEGDARRRIHEDVRIRVMKDMADSPARVHVDRIGPVIAGAFGDMKWASKATVKDLGTKEIEGIKAQGKLKSYEIPAGEIGNRNPIVVATESWYAPDLQVTLLNKRTDPRTGERTWRMAGIKRDEPAAALFAVPSDYTVKDVMANIRKIEKTEKK